MELILLPARTEWAADVDQLRTLAITAPRDKLTSATISHHGRNTKQLDGHHYLVQAKDLGPWYSQPLDYYDEPDPELTAKARTDFGDMLFTHATAQHLGITKPH